MPLDAFSSVALTKNTQSPLHVDALNCGPSCIVAFGDFDGGELWVHGRGALDVKTPQTFDGNTPHATLPWRTPVAGERYSAIFFLHACHDRLARADGERLADLGFRLPPRPVPYAYGAEGALEAAAAAVAADPALRGRVLLADDADDDDDDFVEARPSGRDRGDLFYGAELPRGRRVEALSDDPDDEGRAPEPAAPPFDEDEFAFDVDDDVDVDADDEDAAVGEEEDTDRCWTCGEVGELLLCDGCDAPYHVGCVGLDAAPEGDWSCERCAAAAAPAARRPRRRGANDGGADARKAVQAAARQQDQLRRVMRGAGGTAREAMRREKERQTEVGYHAASDTWPGFDSDDDDDDDAFDDDERKKSKKTNFVSNDRSGHDDQNAY